MMRRLFSIPQWVLVVWVVGSIVFSVIGGYLSYTQSRQRTRDLSEIGLLEDDVDLVRIGELLLGLAEPEAPVREGFVVVPTATSSPPIATPPLTATQSDPTSTIDPDATVPPATPTPPISETPVEVAQYNPYNDPRRVTILLMGIDQRQGEQGPFRTDTMMLLSMDPIGKTGAILSIPRDLWIDYPGIGQNRINNANALGEQRQYPGGGPEYAKRTVSRVIGVPVDFYVMVNFDAFVTFIDVIGEVEVCPPEPIDDPKYPDGSYGFRPIYFDAGCQSLGADRLLEYARTRAGADSDIGRSRRQQEVIFAVRQKILSAGGVLDVVSNPTTLWDAVKDNVRTDINLNLMVELALLAETIPRDNIRNSQITFGEVEIGTGPEGEQILVPIQSDINQLVIDLFRPAGESSTIEGS